MNNRQLLLTKDGSHTIFIPELDETYHSTNGAIQESNHVFITEGLQSYLNSKLTNEIRIFEVGFGTGLNVLLTSIFAKQHNVKIQYEAIEPFPLNAAIVDDLNYVNQFKNQGAQDMFSKIHASHWNEFIPIHNRFKLRKIDQRIQDCDLTTEFDICFFDAFAPSKQPDMWEKPVLEKVYNSLKEGGLFVTYCAKGQLKRDLKDLGFEVVTVEGPPGKFEMIRGIKT